MHYIVYQAYGSDEIAYQALYSVLSLYKVGDNRLPDDTGVVIYTDREPLFREWLPDSNVAYRLLSPAIVGEWRGAGNFVHRVKIKVLQDFCEHYYGDLLYVDTDTVFLQSPLPALRQIAAQQQMMHLAEYFLSDNTPRARKISKRVIHRPFILAGGTTIYIPAQTQMWNAGAIGLSVNARPLLQPILELSDELYCHYPAHVMEQLAFSFLLAQNGSINPLNDYINHYWNFKEFGGLLAQFFNHHRGKSVEELTPVILTINPQILIQLKLLFEQLPGWRRALMRLSGKAWKMKSYEALT